MKKLIALAKRLERCSKYGDCEDPMKLMQETAKVIREITKKKV